MNKAYFKESFTSGLRLMLFIFVIGLLIYPLIILTSKYQITFHYLENQYGYPTDIIIRRYVDSPDVGIIIAYLAVLCYFVPIFKFSYLHKKRQIDTLYCLPIKRETIINVNLLVGYLQIIIPYTVLYFLGMGILALKADFFAYVFYIPLYFVSLLISLGLYLFNSFIFSRGNTVLDGIILMIAYSFVCAMIVYAISSTFHLYNNFEYGITFCPFISWGEHFSDLIKYYGAEEKYSYSIYEISLWDYLFPIILGILGYLGCFLSARFDKAERSEQITDSYFGYRVIIPFYFVSSFYIFSINVDLSIILLIFLLVLYLVTEVIHYRKFKLPKKVFIILICCLVGVILLSIVGGVISEYYAKFAINE